MLLTEHVEDMVGYWGTGKFWDIAALNPAEEFKVNVEPLFYFMQVAVACVLQGLRGDSLMLVFSVI